MSISGDLLTSATPARLLCRRGTWVLEVVRLVAVERNVFQPRVQRLEGTDAVLQHLKRSGDNPSLAAAASQLMRGARSEEERAFDAVDGEWVPGELGRRDSTRPSAPPPGPSHSSELAELRAELLVMRASHERLRERVQRLEAQLHTGRRAPDVVAMPPTPSFVMPSASDAPPQVHVPSVPVAPAATRISTASSVPPHGMTLPTVEAVESTLRNLIGDHISVHDHRPLSFDPSALGECWVSRLINDEGKEIGAIVADRAATVSLGGALIGLAAAELESLDAPTDDVVSGMSEVSNTLCETINQEPGGPSARAKPIEPLKPAMLAWVETGRGLELELNGGAGRLFLFAR